VSCDIKPYRVVGSILTDSGQEAFTKLVLSRSASGCREILQAYYPEDTVMVTSVVLTVFNKEGVVDL
jgi:hypothetical protein